MQPAAYFLFGGAAVAGLLATWLCRVVAVRTGFVNKPNPIVPQHKKPVALMGGLGIAAGAGATLFFVSLFGQLGFWDVPGDLILWKLLIPGYAFLLLGTVDDLRPLSARSKLALQLIVAWMAAQMGLVHTLTGWFVVDFAFSVALIIVLVNAFNITDVCDGLVAGTAFVALVAWAILDPSHAPLAMIVAGACVGFLFFNAPPATIFMGDGGSHFLGYMLAALMLAKPAGDGVWPYVLQVALVSAVVLFELTLLVVTRGRQGLPWWQGSPDHFSLRLQANGLSRWQTDAAAWSGGAVCGVAAFAVAHVAFGEQMLIAAVVGLGVVLCWKVVIGMAPPVRGVSAPRPRRLLWIHQNFVSARQPGNSRPVHVISALLEQGWHVDVIASQRGYLGDTTAARDGAPVVIEREGGLTIHRLAHGGGLDNRGGSYVRFMVCAMRYLWGLGHVDAVYASTPPLPQVLLAVLVSVWKRAPMMLEVRDLWPAFLTETKLVRSRPVLVALEWIESLSYRYAERCIPVSPPFAPFVEAMGVPRRRIVVAPTGAESRERAADAAAAWRARHGLDGRFVVAYTGSFNEAYGLEAVLAAAERTAVENPNIHWVFAGNGRLRGAVEAAAARCATIHYLDALPKDELLPVLDGADLGLVTLADLPLIKMCMPGKLFDYMAAGLPVLCLCDGIAGAMVGAAGAGLTLAAADAERIAAAVQRMASMPAATRQALGASGRAWVRRYMTTARMGRAIARAVEPAMAEGARRSRVGALLSSAALATLDVGARRSPRVAAAFAARDMSAFASASLAEWLSARTTGGAPDAEEAPLAVPRLLSAYGVASAEVAGGQLALASGPGAEPAPTAAVGVAAA